MTTIRRRVLFAVALLAVMPLSARAQAVPTAETGLDGLTWLAGCWRQGTGGRVTDEQWMAPRAGLMMGMSRTVAGGRVRQTERLLIRAVDGGVEYVADPSGQREATFTATGGDSLWTFANDAHDFPQRIIYRRVGTDSLVARIEGVEGGRERGVDFPMVRARCPG